MAQRNRPRRPLPAPERSQGYGDYETGAEVRTAPTPNGERDPEEICRGNGEADYIATTSTRAAVELAIDDLERAAAFGLEVEGKVEVERWANLVRAALTVPRPEVSREAVEDALGVLEDAINGCNCGVARTPEFFDAVATLRDLTAPRPEELREERYWCGCVRAAWWMRCERHVSLDHDAEPQTQAIEDALHVRRQNGESND